MSRRTFVRGVGLGLLAPFTLYAQLPGKLHRLGILHARFSGNPFVEAFKAELRELGYREGHNLRIEYRWAEGKPERFPELATQLVDLKVDVIFTATTPGALAAKRATTTIPIVFVAVGDPVGAGVVPNLARPDGNVTGLTHYSVELVSKTLKLIKDVVSGLARVAVLAPIMNPTTAHKLRGLDAAARALGVKLQVVEVRRPSDFEAAFAAIRQEKPDALLPLLDVLTVTYAKDIADFALTTRLPTMFEQREFVEAGGLMSYGTSYPAMHRRAATYVDKILKGVKPAQLPVEQPTTFELVINLKTAQALGLTIPPIVLVQATDLLQ